MTLDEALRLLTLPRLVGKDAGGRARSSPTNGRYGPYIKRGDDSRSLEDEEKLFTVTLDEALALLAAPKTRGSAGRPRRRCGSWASTRSPRSRWSSRTAGSART